MKFAIITHALHKVKGEKLYAYEPYVKEMNIWLLQADEVLLLSPTCNDKINEIEIPYNHKKICLNKIPNINILTLKNKIRSLTYLPLILIKIFKVMMYADHIHIRCPGNIGLLGCAVQVLFPSKPKTVKYAGNWDPNSKQPTSYKIQKWILSNTFLTKNCKVLVYGNWKNQSKNIVPFFTASYKKSEIEIIEKKSLSATITFLFVGSFSEGKQPFLSVKVIENLILKGFNVKLEMFGEGAQFNKIKEYVKNNSLEKTIILHGNKSKDIVKKAYKKAHFLLFISKSEGWPKVVAEAMFWRCLPISSKVSCVAYMLDNGARGSLVMSNVTLEELKQIIIKYIENEGVYQKQVLKAQEWSQQFTIDKFSKEIKKIIHE
ncbi:MAG: glycosyltransferase [Polaribacter sp.]|uniref:glycosyltransferase n=1 Tax=Polaribacter sp. TaxID=1920175 RepID=UPI002F35B1E2